MVWIEVVIAVALMPVAGYALIGVWRGGRWLAESRYKTPPPKPLERLEADLRRLRAELEDTETRSGLTAKHHRVQALRGAYTDALASACERLQVTPPTGGDRATQAEIYRVEAELRLHGLDVRETAVH